jgi:hypothetical protein
MMQHFRITQAVKLVFAPLFLMLRLQRVIWERLK